MIERFLKRLNKTSSDGTAKTRRTHLLDFKDWCERNEIDPVTAEPFDIDGYFLECLDRGYAENTIISKFQSVSVYYQFLEGLADKRETNPVEALDLDDYTDSKRTEKSKSDSVVYVTRAEVDLMCENVGPPKLRNELIIRMLFQTAMRRSEIVLVELEKMDRENHAIEIYAPKTDDFRTVRYQKSLDFLIDRWIDVNRESFPTRESERLFVSLQSETMSEKQIGHLVHDAAENAGIQEQMYEDASGKPRYRVTPPQSKTWPCPPYDQTHRYRY